MGTEPDRNIAMELVRVTEAAALACARWMGRGDKHAVDQAAVDAMRLTLNHVSLNGIVVIGEGEKDEAPMLFNGERLGSGDLPEVDIAVDPVDGTTLTSLGRSGAISVVALSERGTMFSPGKVVYMDKIVVGAAAKGAIDINAPVADNLRSIAKAMSRDVDDVTVVVLDRPRHEKLVEEIRQAGARIKLISDGDISGAIMTAVEGTGSDVLMGVGGSPEGVITACALKCLGGEIQCRLWPRNDDERAWARAQGMDVSKVLTIDDLVRGNNVFFAATGVTSGELLKGVQYTGHGAKTWSLSMRSKSGTVRTLEASHRWDKLMMISQIRFDEPQER